jgi:hypothetical protein
VLNLAFDFVCDEAPLYAAVAKKLRQDGYIIKGLTLGRRWERYWRGIFNTCPIDINYYNVPDLKTELERLENVYGEYAPSSFLQADRFLAGLPRYVQTNALVRTFETVEEALLDNKTDIYFSTGVAYMYNLVTLAVCRKHGIPHVSIHGLRGDKPLFTISLGKGGSWDFVEETYKALLEGAPYKAQEYDNAKKYLHSFRTAAPQPFYLKSYALNHELNGTQIREFFIRLKNWLIDGWGKEAGDYITQPPWWYVARDLKRTVRARWVGIRSKRIFDEIQPDDKYYIFPIHLQPEASTLILAEWYVNQQATIANIARCLPADHLLYVKEHRRAVGYNSLDFYRVIKSIHNVRLISPYADTPSLVKNSHGIIVLTSTMGWEALLMNRPVYLFGSAYYQNIEGVRKIKNYEELRKMLADDRKSNPDRTAYADDDQIIKFLIALQRESFEGLFTVAKMNWRSRVMEKDNIDNLGSSFKVIIDRIHRNHNQPAESPVSDRSCYANVCCK